MVKIRWADWRNKSVLRCYNCSEEEHVKAKDKALMVTVG